MAPRSIGSVTVYFGLVAIPAKLYSATKDAPSIPFSLLHRACGARLKQQYHCANDNSLVEGEQIAKGYEFEKGRFVMFSSEELEKLQQTPDPALEIAEFVPLSRIDPVYFDKPYYLGPEAGAVKAYRVLAEAIELSGLVGLGRYAARGKQYFVMLRTSGSRLVMQQLLRVEEVRPVDELEVDATPAPAEALRLALQLLQKDASDAFSPEDYPDEVRERTLARIEQKVAGKEIVVEPAPERPGMVDLVEALKASLNATTRRPPKRAARVEKKPPKRAAK